MADTPDVRHIRKSLSPAAREKYRSLRATIDRKEADELKARGLALKAHGDRLRTIGRELQAERQRQGLTLTEVARRAGMDKARLSRLENEPYANVKIQTIEQVAAALGKQVLIT